MGNELVTPAAFEEHWKTLRKDEIKVYSNFLSHSSLIFAHVGYMQVSESVILLFMFHNKFSFLGNVSRFPF